MSQLNLLNACSQKIRKEALQLIGTTEANIEFGTGAGGDTIKKIDLAAENAIIQTLQNHNPNPTEP